MGVSWLDDDQEEKVGQASVAITETTHFMWSLVWNMMPFGHEESTTLEAPPPNLRRGGWSHRTPANVFQRKLCLSV